MKSSCSDRAGKVQPVIDRNRCEGRAFCVAVCPYDVLSLGKLQPGDKQQMTLLGRAKALLHGNRQAFVTDPANCHACNRCVKVCPEDAIRLEAYRRP